MTEDGRRAIEIREFATTHNITYTKARRIWLDHYPKATEVPPKDFELREGTDAVSGS